MKVFRSRRRVVTAALAVAALVFQALVPHVHVWQAGGHDAALAAVAVEGAGVVAPAHDANHDRATCPTCQALAQSRQLAPAPRTAALTFVPVRAAVFAPRADVLASDERVAPAAPRAPPVFA
jgi:hypothetical protein